MSHAPESVAPSRPDFNITSDHAWFAGTTFMSAYSIAIWYWYPNWIRRTNAIPWRDADYADFDYLRDVYDKEWAWGTEEMKAWNTTAWMQFGLYFPGWVLWLLNRNWDNEGGKIHQVQHWHAKFLVLVAPFAILFNAARLFIVHNFGATASDNEYAFADLNSSYMLQRHFYRYSSTDYSDIFAYKQEDRYRMALVWLFLYAWVNIVAQAWGPMERHYEEVRAVREMEEAEYWSEILAHVEGPAEEAAEEQVAEEEEVFF